MNSKFPKAKHNLSIINTKSRPYLTWIKNGIKTAEGRVNNYSCQKMEIGETIVLYDLHNNQYIYGLISFKHVYRTFREMLSFEGVKNMLPFLENNEIEKGIEVYNSFPGSIRVKIFGCVAIGINVLNFSDGVDII